jgi:hypothetical protein
MTIAKQRLKKVKVEIEKGYRVKGDPVTLEREMERVRKATGSKRTNAKDLVSAAANPKSPLHDEFEWDDAVCGHKYRLHQARYLMRAIVVTYETIPMGKAQTVRIIRTRAYTNPRPKGQSEGSDYSLTVDILDDAAMRAALLQEALLDIERFKNKYAILDEFADLLDQMNKLLTRLRKRKK